MCFNPRSHEGSDPQSFSVQGIVEVSIHAPTKGATDSDLKRLQSEDGFNPRSHEGSDENIVYELIGDVVSIHAPTKGATSILQYSGGLCCVSIHAPTKGATIPDLSFLQLVKFQSTLPRRVRRHFPA